MLKSRIITAALLLPPAVLIILLGGPALVLLTLAIFAIINYEYYSFATGGSMLECIQLVVVSSLLPLGYLAYGTDGIAAAMLLAAMLMFTLTVLAVEREVHEIDYRRRLPACLGGLCYCGLLGAMLVAVASEVSADALLWLLLTVIAADTCAYFGGRAFGSKLFAGAKLAPRISPKKTVAGAIFGLLGAAACAALTAWALDVRPPEVLAQDGGEIFLAACWGLVVGVLAVFGDLAESLVKRVYDVKDSGRLLPGHGGMLDRVDALLFAAPVLFFFP